MNESLAALLPPTLLQRWLLSSGRIAPRLTRFDIAAVVLFTWTVLALSCEINRFYIPYVNWISLPFVLAVASRSARRLRLPISRRSLYAIPLLAIMALTSMLNDMDVQGLLQAVKLSVILLILFPLIGGESRFIRISMYAAGFATILNAVLMAFGRLGLLATAAECGGGRWGTILNLPGSLAFLGLLTFGYGAYGSLQEKHHTFWYIAVTFSSIYIVMTDGSRTGALCLMLITMYIFYATLRSRGARRTAIRRLLCFASIAFGSALVAGSGGFFQGDATLPVNSRVTKLFEGDSGGMGDTVQQRDFVRYGALMLAMNEIGAHPLWGHGLGSTKYFPGGETVVVHNAYLQSWADLGFFGFVATAATLLWWLPQLRRALKLIQNLRFPEDQTLCHGAICGVIAYSFICLYHPIGVEISDWIHFLIPSAIFAKLLMSRNRNHVIKQVSDARA